MRCDKIHDALNYLDDDLVESVNALRTGEKLRKIHWLRWVSLAACLCIAAAGLYLAWPYMFYTYEECIPEDNFADIGSSVSGGYTDNAGEIIGNSSKQTEANNSQKSAGEETDALHGGSDESLKVYLAYVKIESWQEGGFSGSIVEEPSAGETDPGVLKSGDTVVVKFSDDILIVMPGGASGYAKDVPDSEDFPVESVVGIEFTGCKPENNSVDSSSGKQYVLYADRIFLAEND